MKHRKDLLEEFYKKYVAEKFTGVPEILRSRGGGVASAIVLEAYENMEPGTVLLKIIDGVKPAAFTSAIHSLSKKGLIDKSKFWVRTKNGKNVYLVKVK